MGEIISTNGVVWNLGGGRGFQVVRHDRKPLIIDIA